MRTGSLGRNSSLGGEFLHLLASQNLLKLIGGNGEILSGAHPRSDQTSQTLVVKLLYQARKAAGLVVDHLHDRGHEGIRTAAQHAAQFLASHIFQKTHNASKNTYSGCYKSAPGNKVPGATRLPETTFAWR